MSYQSHEHIRTMLSAAYLEVYDEIPSRMDNAAKIYQDLHANSIDPAFALEWLVRTSRLLSLDERKLPKPEKGKDYTIGEIIDIFRTA